MNIVLNELASELWKIRNPHLPSRPELLKKLITRITQKPTTPLQISQKAYLDLTTARNRHLITSVQQDRLRHSVVAFFGMSVGSHAALTWMMESRADAIKIVDPDSVSMSNLNRLRMGISQIGKLKVDIVKDQLLDINPFAKVLAFSKTAENDVEKIFSLSPNLSAVVDEIDDFESKLLLRKLAKHYRLPLISSADVGDNIALDIERYDLNPQPEPFLKRIPNLEQIKFAKLSPQQRRKLIINLVGFEHNSEAMLDSILSIGGSIPTWPQLGATATISGGVVTTTLKKILLNENVNSGRYYISLDDLLVADFNQSNMIKKRQSKIALLNRLLNRP